MRPGVLTGVESFRCIAKIMNASIPIALLGGSAGPAEIIVIFLLILVLFGPRRLPEIARMIGKTLHELRQASEDFKDQVLSIDVEPVDEESVVAGDDQDVPDGLAEVAEEYENSYLETESDYDLDDTDADDVSIADAITASGESDAETSDIKDAEKTGRSHEA